MIESTGIGANRGTINSRPVTITGKLVDSGKKKKTLQAQKAKKQGANLSFFITTNEPASIVEERKRLFQITDSLKSQNINEKNRITIPNGAKYEEPISKLEISYPMLYNKMSVKGNR